MEKEDVNPVTESQVTESTTETVEESQPVEAGSKTDPNLLLKSLQEEREKRRELEQLLAEKQATPDIDVFSDEGKLLKQQIEKLQESIVIKDLQEKFPALKDKSSEFEEYRKDYPGVPLEKVSKLFLAEKDLLENPVKRKGLEQTSGGGRSIPQPGMTADEVGELRTKNFPKYLKMVQEGKIKIG